MAAIDIVVLLIGAAAFGVSLYAAGPWVERRSRGMENRRKHIATLFTLPLIFATGLLSFAHGANDVANAVGPLAAIVAAAQTGSPMPTRWRCRSGCWRSARSASRSGCRCSAPG